MKVIEITQTEDVAESIKILKGSKKVVDVAELKKQYNVSKHEIFDTAKRADKIIKNDDGEQRTEKVNRIGLAIQKRIVKSAVSFSFGNPVNLQCQPNGEAEKQVISAIKKILKANKINSFNRKVAKDLFRSTEVAEIWFTVPTSEKHEDYGFSTNFKLRSLKISPWNGDELFPKFDETGNMICFSRSYQKIEGSETTEYFDVYTDEEVVQYKKDKTGWLQPTTKTNTIGKIPVVYATDEQADWEDVQKAIERLEILLSNYSDTNDYFASPIIFIEGEITGFAKKGETGKIIQGEVGSKAQYLSWQHAPESVKLEIETLFKIIYSLTQTPDISFENVKDLNQISGIALEMLFMDAHLKVQEKREIFDEYLERRLNIILAFVGKLNTQLAKAANTIEIESEIVPYIINDISTLIKNLVDANGGKPILSQKTSVDRLGLVADSEQEFKQIQEEEKAANIEQIGASVL